MKIKIDWFNMSLMVSYIYFGLYGFFNLGNIITCFETYNSCNMICNFSGWMMLWFLSIGILVLYMPYMLMYICFDVED